MRILLIGPLPPSIGGDKRMFDFLTTDLKKSSGFIVHIVNTDRGYSSNNPIVNIFKALRIIIHIMFFASSYDIISFHAGNRGMYRFGPVIYLLTHLYKKPLIIRLFGGSFDEYYLKRGKIGKWILQRTVLSADVCLFQTKSLITFFERISAGRIEWFSNYTRSVTQDKETVFQQVQCNRFIFLGRVRKIKGIEIILQAAPDLPSKISIDIFGPLVDYSAEEINRRGCGRVRYKGLLTHEEALRKIAEYDALVLPTIHYGEGYPGVIVEAYSHAKPVITTRWRSIPEIVNDDCGILIEPENVKQFLEAVLRLHSDMKLYARLKNGARQQSKQFSDEYWTNRFIQLCEEVTVPV